MSPIFPMRSFEIYNCDEFVQRLRLPRTHYNLHVEVLERVVDHGAIFIKSLFGSVPGETI
jgi:hypothetical protein